MEQLTHGHVGLRFGLIFFGENCDDFVSVSHEDKLETIMRSEPETEWPAEETSGRCQLYFVVPRAGSTATSRDAIFGNGAHRSRHGYTVNLEIKLLMVTFYLPYYSICQCCDLNLVRVRLCAEFPHTTSRTMYVDTRSTVVVLLNSMSKERKDKCIII